MADTIASQSPAAPVQATHRQVRQAHRERPDRHWPQGDDKRREEAPEPERGSAIRKPDEAEAVAREPYRPNSQQSQVLAQEMAASRDKKPAEMRRPLTRRSGPYKSRRDSDQAFVTGGGTIKLSV